MSFKYILKTHSSSNHNRTGKDISAWFTDKHYEKYESGKECNSDFIQELEKEAIHQHKFVWKIEKVEI